MNYKNLSHTNKSMNISDYSCGARRRLILPGMKSQSTDVNMVARRLHDVPSVLRHVISITRQLPLRHNDDNQLSVTSTVGRVQCKHDNVSDEMRHRR